MLVVIVLAARWTVRRYPAPRRASTMFGVGAVALSLLLLVEFTVVLSLRGLSIPEYINSRDPIAGSIYLLLLALFAGMPWVLRTGSRLRP